MITAEEALQRLQAGNARFVSGIRNDEIPIRQLPDPDSGQTPFAIILGCSDSRVPAEIVFDQGLGDLFVIRIAGNIVAPSQVGSVEFAVEQFATPLVVVLGHSNCGAVTATLDILQRQPQEISQEEQSPNVLSIVNRIRPGIESICNEDQGGNSQALLATAIRANISASVDSLRHASPMLERLLASGELDIVGAEYSLADGTVDFFDRR